MSVRYTWVQWNKHKKVYDLLLLLGVVLFIGAYMGISIATMPEGQATSALILLIRATGSCAIVMLHLILAIGPLARLWPGRFAPLLYNRRHLGVTMFLIALIHAALQTVWYSSFGKVDPLTAILTMNTRVDSWAGLPFEWFGLGALVILFFMAATSHDFWLKNLSPRWWKMLHMGVYVAYVLLVFHVALGTIQSERSLVYPLLLGGGAAFLTALHVMVGLHEIEGETSARTNAIINMLDVAGYVLTPVLLWQAGGLVRILALVFAVFFVWRVSLKLIKGEPLRQSTSESAQPTDLQGGWIDVASIDEIPQDRAKVVKLKSKKDCQRIAVFRYGDSGEKLSAVESVCAHQGGPLGEGKVIDGCITCPWHGYQYRPGDGQSPPPYTEKIATYEVRVEDKRVLLNPEAKAPGTPVEPALIGGESDG